MKSNQEKLPFLIELLDDDSPLVRQAVIRELAGFGAELYDELNLLPVEITPKERLLLNQILAGPRRCFLKRQWSSWFSLPNEHMRLEAALTLLAEYQSGLEFKGQLAKMLDALTLEYKSFHSEVDAHSLAGFLFKEQGFAGAQEDYYNPANSNLIYVLKQRRGIPISLSCVYMMVGRRLGLDIRGCNSPRHFLTIVDNAGSKELVDCFHSGNVIGEKDIVMLSQEASLSRDEALKMEAGTVDIVRRILGNLIFAYQQVGQDRESVLMVHLLKEIQLWQEKYVRKSEKDSDKSARCFKLGQTVRHLDEGYRGLIVDYDLYYADGSDAASDDERPDYNQPWYRVLVDQTDRALYVPHCQLEKDLDGSDIENPLVSFFFSRTTNGLYIRNHMPWLE
ncbi:MAG: heat shock protein HspQ [Candidatus Omnitrophica bacterium]|nr:heat shock protein HspQ [Candidatus Omnitrophota bacterium]